MVEGEKRERQHPRVEASAYVDYTGTEVLLHHRISNISMGGVCITSPNVEEVGTVVDLVINFPDDGASVALKGEVVWVNHDAPTDMGIRYLQLDDEKREQLRTLIARVKK